MTDERMDAARRASRRTDPETSAEAYRDTAPRRPTAEQAFAQFCRRNGWFLPRLAEMTYELRSRGQKRVSVKLLFERLRTEMADQGNTYRLENSFTALAARRVMELYPDLDGCFATRKRAGE